MTLPNFLCVGAQKAGTSWLCLALQQHPDLWVPPLKELHFFNTRFVPEDAKWTDKAIRSTARSVMQVHFKKTPLYQVDFEFLKYVASLATDDVLTEDWYRRVFSWHAAQDKVRGEFTPAYMSLPPEAIAYIREFVPDLKIIIQVRSPLERALSQIRMNVARLRANKLETGLWQKALDSAILERGDYERCIPLWQQHFPADRLLILPYGDIAADPLGLMARVESFLGLKPFAGYQKLDQIVHKTPLIVVPRGIVESLRPEANRQREFISRTLGEDFALRMGSPKKEVPVAV